MRSCTGYRWPSSLTRPPSPVSGWMLWTGACCFSRMSAEGKAGLLDNGMEDAWHSIILGVNHPSIRMMMY